MMDKKDRLILDTVSEIDDQIIDRQSAKRYLLFRAWRKRMRKRNWFIGISSAAASILLLVIGIMLIMQNLTPGTGGGTQPNVPPVGDPKQVPVYQGMTVSNEMPVIESASAPFESLVLSNSSHVYGNQKVDKDKPFGEGKKPIKDAVSDSLQITGAPEGYFAQAGQTIYITVHFDNPDLFEIWSFTLGGQPKQVGMEGFVVGHDLQTVTVPMVIPEDAEGMIEYTIDAIKYVDGTEFKDVRMEGDDTVRVTVTPEIQPTASIENTTIGNDRITFTVSVADPAALIAATEGEKLLAVLYDGEALLFQKEISLSKTTVTFDGLSEDTLYQYAIVGVYDALDGTGTAVHMLCTQSFFTDYSYRLIYRFDDSPAVKYGSVIGIDFGVAARNSSNSSTVQIPATDPTGKPIATIQLRAQPLILPQFIYGEHFDTYIKAPLEKLVAEGGMSELEYQKLLNLFVVYDLSTMEDYQKDSYYENYPFMKYFSSHVWYQTNTNRSADDLIKVREILDGIGFDANTLIGELALIMQQANAYDVWQENRYRFQTVSVDKEILLEVPENFPMTVDLPAVMLREENGTWENGVCYVSTVAIAIEDGLTDVVLRDGTTNVLDGAFQNHTTLKSVTIPASAVGGFTGVGSWGGAFDGCPALTDLYFHGGNKVVYELFANDTPHAVNLHFDSIEALLSSSLECCGETAHKRYVGGEPVTELVIPDGVMTRISSSTFQNWDTLVSVTIPESLTEMGNPYIFAGCTNLKDIYLHGGNKYMTALFDSHFPGGVRSVNLHFDSMEAFLTSATKYCFQEADHKLYIGGELVTKLVIPDGMTEMPFWGDPDVESVTVLPQITAISLPDSITSLERYAFTQFYNLERIDLEDISTLFVGGIMPAMRSGVEIYVNGAPVTDLVIPEGVTEIPYYAFRDWSTLVSVTIPSSVTRIGECAFEGCSSLQEISIPGTVKTVGMLAFNYCSSLERIILEEGVETVDVGAFYGCPNLVLIKLPSTLQVFYSAHETDAPYDVVVEYNGTIAEWKALCSDWESYYNAGITVRCNDGTLAKNV